MKQPITVAIAGLGGRGRLCYAPYTLRNPEKMKLVAIAEPDEIKRTMTAKEYGIPESMQFYSAEEMLQQDKLADVLFVCTQDRQHYDHTIPALQKGYHVLLEKPVSPDYQECLDIQREAEKHQRIVTVCHVLRYTVFYQKLKTLIQSGKIGRIMSIQHYENVGYWHHAHSFVRGSWRNTEESCPMILAKSCHDMDLIHWLMGERCTSVSSFGSLSHFRADQAPAGAAKRCLDGCGARDGCLYDAEKIYVYSDFGLKGSANIWPLSLLAADPTPENIYEALKTGPYGRCVYACDNDVVDHQVVNMEFESGATGSFTMAAFTNAMSRETKIVGTRGDIYADMNTNRIRMQVFGEQAYEFDLNELMTDAYGHGGGDSRMLDEFYELLTKERTAEDDALSSISASIHSHAIAFAAEESRLLGGSPIQLSKNTL